MNRYSTSVIKAEMYLKQFMKLFYLVHPYFTLSKSRTLYTTFWFVFIPRGQKKSPDYRDVCKLLLSKWPHTRYWVFWEILLTHILKGGGMNLLWKKIKPQKQSTHTHTLHQRISRTSWIIAWCLANEEN